MDGERQTDRHCQTTDRQTGRQAGRQAGRQTDRQRPETRDRHRESRHRDRLRERDLNQRTLSTGAVMVGNGSPAKHRQTRGVQLSIISAAADPKACYLTSRSSRTSPGG